MSSGCRSKAIRLALIALVLSAPSPILAEEPLGVVEVAPNVFVYEGAVALMTEANRGATANLGFIVGDDAVAVVDTGGSVAEGRALLAAVRAQTDKPVRYVINTHMHPDHIFGNAAFASLDPSFVGVSRLREALAERGDYYVEASKPLIGEALASELRIIPPSLLVEDELTLDLGDRQLLLRAWPTGHTNNDLTVLDEVTGTLFAGDLVFVQHVPALDGSIRGWLANIDALAAIPAERVVPGHGPPSAPWPGAIDDPRRYLSKVATEVRRLIAEGGRIEEAPAKVAQDERDRWQLFDEFHARNVTAAFAELEWE